MRAVKRLLLAVLMTLCAVMPARAATDFEAANEFYDSGNYDAARMAYEMMVERGDWSANLFYNLGNTLHRLNKPGAAVLAYERALALEPAHPEARVNLNLIRGRTGAAAWPASWLDAIFPGRQTASYSVVGAVAAWSAVALLCWILGTPTGDKAGRWFACVVALLVTAYAAVAVWHLDRRRASAIVVAQIAEIRLAPADTAATGGSLPGGSEVRVLSVRGDWSYCALPQDRRGWISSKALERVWLGAS